MVLQEAHLFNKFIFNKFNNIFYHIYHFLETAIFKYINITGFFDVAPFMLSKTTGGEGNPGVGVELRSEK